MPMSNSVIQEDKTVVEGFPGLFNASDITMRFIFLSGIPEVSSLQATKADLADFSSDQVQALMADVPFVAIGVSTGFAGSLRNKLNIHLFLLFKVTTLAFAIVFILVGRLNRFVSKVVMMPS